MSLLSAHAIALSASTRGRWPCLHSPGVRQAAEAADVDRGRGSSLFSTAAIRGISKRTDQYGHVIMLVCLLNLENHFHGWEERLNTLILEILPSFVDQSVGAGLKRFLRRIQIRRTALRIGPLRPHALLGLTRLPLKCDRDLSRGPSAAGIQHMSADGTATSRRLTHRFGSRAPR